MTCQHVWKKYVGFNDEFEYCKECDKKRDPTVDLEQRIEQEDNRYFSQSMYGFLSGSSLQTSRLPFNAPIFPKDAQTRINEIYYAAYVNGQVGPYKIDATIVLSDVADFISQLLHNQYEPESSMDGVNWTKTASNPWYYNYIRGVK